jgi:diguanylate cyclase (GGDEF)-like protein/PAS domain S-box-containing protein
MSSQGPTKARSEPRAPGDAAVFSTEQRLQFLIELSSDYYWEIDTEGRFTTILHGNARNWQHAASRLLGKTRWEVEGAPLDGSWEDHMADMDLRRNFDGFVVERPEADGSVRFFESSGRPRFDTDGTFLGYTGITRQVTEMILERKLNRLDASLTRLFAATSEEGNLALALELVCKSQRWTTAKYWLADADGAGAKVLARCLLDEEERAGETPKQKELRRRSSEELVATAFRSREIFWTTDLPGRRGGRDRSDSDCAIVVPVILRGKVIGAIEFRNARIAEPSDSLKGLLSRLAMQFASVYERAYAIQRLRESESRYSSTIELAAIGISHVALDGRFLHANKHLVEMLGYSESELKEMTVKDVSHPDDRSVTDTLIERMASREIGSFTAEKRYVSRSGETVWVRINSTINWDNDGNPRYHISTIENISDRKRAEERVEFLATHDELSGLPSRTFFNEILARSIRSAKRRGKRGPAVLFMDMDRFKVVNDSLGHDAGDALLKDFASRISACVRSADCVARYGGDEFTVLLEETESPEDAAIVARKIIAAAHQPVVLKGQECRITVSIGIARYPEHGSEAIVLIRNADLAMYAAKQNGKNCVALYHPDLAPMSLERLTLEQHLQGAIEREEFRVRYQAKVDAQTGRIKGVEALLRWWNHELGTITPAQFIPVAEDTGLIVSMGKWVLRQACEQSVAWLRAGLPRIVMCVNLSPRQFSHENLIGDVREVLEQTEMPPELLELEITESMLVANIDHAIAIALELRGLGIRLAIDDFGTGYSSLAQLKRFPLDTLKIDRSFVRDLPSSKEDMAITEAIIAMGRTLGVSIVAEGVESVMQRDFLAGLACDELQGYLFGRPSHPDEIAQALRNGGRIDLPADSGNAGH